MRCNASLAAFFVALFVATSVGAQDKPVDAMQALRAAAKADKRGLVESTLALTEAEAKRFWPLYDAYQRDLERANRRRTVALVEVVGSPAPIGNLHARNVARELVAADEDELRARRKLRDGVKDALPPRKAIRYLQLEWKIRAAQYYDLAVTVPLLDP